MLHFSSPRSLFRHLVFSLYLLLLCPLTAQVGVTYQHRISHDNFTSDDHPNGNLLENGYEVDLEYRIELRPVRLTFAPGIFYGQYQGRDNGVEGFDLMIPFDYKVEDYGVQAKVMAYPFDFKRQKSKRSESLMNVLASGLYLQFLLGGGSSASEGEPLDGSQEFRRFYQFSGNVGGGLGIDLPIGDHILISPTANCRTYFTPVEVIQYYNVPQIIALVTDPPRRVDWTFGLRVGVRLDKRDLI